MASTVKHLRSSTANKRPTASGLADGQLGINTASGTPGVFFKDSAGTVTKVGPAHVGSTAPNATPAGSAGNSLGELWVNNSTTIKGLNYYTGSAFVNLTPSGTTTVAGLVELATDAETQTGTDTVRAVTPSGLQSKVSNSISTTSSTTIASATAVKTAYDLANAALPKSGGRVTGELEIGPAGSLVFEGSTDDGFETTIAVVNPTADRTVTFPNVTGTVVTTGDTGSVTSTMILDGTIVNADVNASAAIVDTKLATIATAGKVSNSATTATNANTASAIVARDASGNFSAGTITAALTGNASTVTTNANLTGDVTSVGNATSIASGVIVNADVNASAAIAGTKISPNFGSQDITIGDKIIHDGDTNTAIRFPAANTVSVETGGSERARIDSSGRLLVGTSTSIATTGGTAGLLQIHSATGTTQSISNWASSASDPARLVLAKSQGGSVGTRGIVNSAAHVGLIRFAGDDGTNFIDAATISAFVDGTPGTNDMPGRLVFSTTSDGAASPTERLRITSAGVLQVADAGNITVGTTTGTKIGTATTQKLGFYNATPVVQPAAVADATTAVDVITQLNALLAKLRTLGIIAT
jgi:hypothetical protein